MMSIQYIFPRLARTSSGFRRIRFKTEALPPGAPETIVLDAKITHEKENTFPVSYS